MSAQLTIIIPVWNGQDRIGALLDALEKQTAPCGSFEIIVVDNGSCDKSAEIARSYTGITVLFEPEPGSYRARNRAVASSRTPYLLFTDADCLPNPDWVAQALDSIDIEPDAGIWAGRITLYREDRTSRLLAFFEELTGFNQEGNVAAGHCVTANWLCTRNILDEVGGFNSEMLSGGDVDCSRRIVAAGHRLVYVDDMVVRHPVRSSMSELIAKRRRVIGGRWKLENWGDKSTATACLFFAKSGARQLRHIMHGRIPNAWKPGVMFVSLIVTATHILEVFRLALGGQPYRS